MPPRCQPRYVSWGGWGSPTSTRKGEVMLARTVPPALRRTSGDWRLSAARAFVISVGLLTAAAIVFWAVGRKPWTPTPPPPAPLEVPTPPAPPPAEPRLNEYVSEDRYVLEALVPGVNPEVHVNHDPLSRRAVL